nr:hypothetical protein B0A51_15797 [Rachicladosporium sp. CCFEE 5018]
MSDNAKRGGRGGRGGFRGDRGGDRGGRGGGRGGNQSRGDSQSGQGGGHLRGGYQSRGGDQARGGGPPRGGGGFRGGPSVDMAVRGDNPDNTPPETGGVYLRDKPILAPDASVTNAENTLVQQTKGKIIDGMPGRTGYGTKGRVIVLRTNYFQLQTAFETNNPEAPLYRYDVDITGDVSRPKRRRLLSQIVADARFNGVSVATDGARIIVTTAKIELGSWATGDSMLLADPSATSPDATGTVPAHVQAARARNTIRFKVDYITSYTLSQMISYLRSTSATAIYDARGDLIQLLNIIMCKRPSTIGDVTAVAGNKFYPNQVHPGKKYMALGGGLTALRGYYSSVRPAVSRILLNLNVSTGAFYNNDSIITLISQSGKGSLSLQEAFIRMLKVEVSYKPSKGDAFTKVKTIIGFAPGPDKKALKRKRFGNSKETRFSYTDASTGKVIDTSVFDYFRTHHGITLAQPDRPVLNVGTRADPQYVPQELCKVLPGQRYGRLLSGDQTTNMLAFAARYPNKNAQSIVDEGLRLMGLQHPDINLQALTVQPFGFSVKTEMLTVPGRILPTPQVKYGKATVNVRNGSWNCDKQTFVRAARFANWAALKLDIGNTPAMVESPNPENLRERDMKNAPGTIDELARYLRNYGIIMGTYGGLGSRRLLETTIENRDANDKILIEIFEFQKKKGCNMLFIVLAKVDKWLYARIKVFGDTKYGIHTICAVGSKLQKGKNQGMYMGNLALKFNIKGGGVNHTVPGAMIAPMDEKTMLMGIDVTHPSPGSSAGAPSIACVVASEDHFLCQWPGSIRKQKGKQEMVGEERRDGDMVNGLVEMVIERLRHWQKKHSNALPAKIIVYRDGVSEGQYALVLEKELPSFETAFKQLYGAQQKWPKMAIIVVGKRHHTRFYPTKQEDADYNERAPDRSSWNCIPGTVVDRGITGRTYHEFYLQAHQGLQGTARSAHYVVIKDDLKFTADALEQLTHNLCYLFSRATKAVSVVPPAYYADILAERGRAYLFTTLQEDHGVSEGSVVPGGGDEWDGSVHPDLRNSTWYV